jgi:hypothetical protein
LNKADKFPININKYAFTKDLPVIKMRAVSTESKRYLLVGVKMQEPMTEKIRK